MSVVIVTDSAASLPPEAVDRFGLVIVPLSMVLGGIVYTDGELTPEEVTVRSSGESVTSSSPSPGAFLKAIEANGTGTGVLVRPYPRR